MGETFFTPAVTTFVSFSAPAMLIAGLTMWVGVERKVRWHPAELLFVYLPYVMLYLFVRMTDDSIAASVESMGLKTAGTIAIAFTGGLVSSLILLPRLVWNEDQVPRFTLTAASAFFISLLCLKMFFLAVVVVNPRSLVPH